MSQSSILATIAEMKRQIATLESLLTTVEMPPSAKEAAAPKVKKVLSPEHLAKLKAGAEAARLKKAEAKAAAGGSSASSVASAPHESDADSSTSSQKRRGPKKLADMTSEELEAHKAKIAANAALTPEEKAAKKAAAAAKKEAAAAKKAAKEAKA